MDQVNKSHNFSAILRNCDAAGVLNAHVVPPESGLDLHHHTSAGTRKWIGVHRHQTVEAAAALLRAEGFALVAAHPSDSSVDYRDLDYTSPTAFIMGAELHGVSPEGLALAERHVTIPMMGMVHSLNVSVATALLLFEARRQREDAGMYEKSRLDPEDFERRLFEWSWPSLAASRRRADRAYPKLTSEGELIPD